MQTKKKLHELRSHCSTYLSALPKEAGFGLTEHENLAAGVPVIGSRWGDMDSEMSAGYWCLHDRHANQVSALKQLAVDHDAAKQVSERGLDFIAEQRTPQRMEESIQQLLDT